MRRKWMWTSLALVMLLVTRQQSGVLVTTVWIWVALACVACLSPATRVWMIPCLICGHLAASEHDWMQAGREACVNQFPRGLAGEVRGRVVRSAERVTFTVDACHGVRVSLRPQTEVRPGDWVVVQGKLRHPRGFWSPGAFSSETFAFSQGYRWTLSGSSSDLRVVAERSSPTLFRLADQLQSWSADVIRKYIHSPSEQALVTAMALGMRGDGEALESTRRAGLGHLVAVSGMHVGSVAMLFWFLTKWAWALLGLGRWVSPFRVAAIAGLCAASVYALMTGLSPSTERAWLLCVFLLAPRLRCRRIEPLDALAYAFLIMAAVRPEQTLGLGFQLSFVATFSLMLSIPLIPKLGGKVLRWMASILATSAVAMAATAPIIMAEFQRAQPAALLANLFAVPLAMFGVLPAALFGLCLEELNESCARAAFLLSEASASLLVRLGETFAPFEIAVIPPKAFECWGFYSLLFVGLCLRHYGRKRASWIVLALSGFLVFLPEPRHDPQGEFRVTFVDVGQGDAAVVETPEGEVWLVDTGGSPWAKSERDLSWPAEQSLIPLLRRMAVKRIDLIAISHAHTDHYGGLASVVREFSVDEVWWVPPSQGKELPPALSANLKEIATRTRITTPMLGRQQRGGVVVDVLGPSYLSDAARADPVNSLNDNSLAFKLSARGRSFLFLGDLEAEGESILDRDRLQADVVKVAHHGSPTSSTLSLVNATGAANAVISCAYENSFGFPSKRVVGRWESAGARVWRIDTTGTLRFSVDITGKISVQTTFASNH